jgi:hypothetical protein
MVAEVVAGLSNAMNIGSADCEPPPENAYPVVFTTVVEARNNLNAALVLAALLKRVKLQTTRTLLLLDVGVIVTVSPVSTYDEVVDITVLANVAFTTCKTRTAPRSRFISELARTWPTVNAAGSAVGVAISLLL